MGLAVDVEHRQNVIPSNYRRLLHIAESLGYRKLVENSLTYFVSDVSKFLMYVASVWCLGNRRVVFNYVVDSIRVPLCVVNLGTGSHEFCLFHRVTHNDIAWDYVKPYIDRFINSFYTTLIFLLNKLKNEDKYYADPSVQLLVSKISNAIDEMIGTSSEPLYIDSDLFMLLEKVYQLTKVRSYQIEFNAYHRLVDICGDESVMDSVDIDVGVLGRFTAKVSISCTRISIIVFDENRVNVLSTEIAVYFNLRPVSIIEIVPRLPNFNMITSLDPETLIKLLESQVGIAIEACKRALERGDLPLGNKRLIRIWLEALYKTDKKPFMETL